MHRKFATTVFISCSGRFHNRFSLSIHVLLCLCRQMYQRAFVSCHSWHLTGSIF